jgi:hypothetical protein
MERLNKDEEREKPLIKSESDVIKCERLLQMDTNTKVWFDNFCPTN